MKVNFWISSNPEIQVGFVDVGNLSSYSANLQPSNKCENCAVVSTNLVQAFSSNQHPVIRVFLNGFNLDRRSGALQVSAAPTNLQGTQLTIKVTMGKKTLIDKICLSWIAFSPSTSSFVSYGGQISKSKFSGSATKDISSTIYESAYSIYGLNLVSIISGKGVSFTSDISKNFIFSASSSVPIDSFSIVYVAVGPYPSKVCANCGA